MKYTSLSFCLPLFLMVEPLSVSAFVPFATTTTSNHHHRRTNVIFSSSTTESSKDTTPLSETTSSSSSQNKGIVMDVTKDMIKKKEEKKNNKRVAVLICPAQFCVPADYEQVIQTLQRTPRSNTNDDDDEEVQSLPTIGTCRVAQLPRTEWIKVARSLPTKSFLDSTLPVYKTLDWYFEAMENALADIYKEEGDDVNVCIVGHSIGGWVARAYLGGLSGSSTAVNRLTQQQTTSFITLGTPHSSPSTALVDQTRGLLKEVESSISCSPQSLTDRGIDLTCVCSSSLSSNIFSTNIEELVAATSYFPLTGKGLMGGGGGDDDQKTKGDGIIPTELAFMGSPARSIEIHACDVTGLPVRHAHVLPTPWNLWDGSAPSISLPDDFVWYGSEGVIGKWSNYVR